LQKLNTVTLRNTGGGGRGVEGTTFNPSNNERNNNLTLQQ